MTCPAERPDAARATPGGLSTEAINPSTPPSELSFPVDAVRLKRASLGSVLVMHQIVRRFLDQADDNLVALAVAISGRKQTEVDVVAHQLLAVSINYGMTAVAHVVRELEYRNRQGAWIEVAKAFTQLHGGLDTTRQRLAELLGEMPPPPPASPAATH
jgi:HPt (histidine-containing phosphotransfer) domain-containing protein